MGAHRRNEYLKMMKTTIIEVIKLEEDRNQGFRHLRTEKLKKKENKGVKEARADKVTGVDYKHIKSTVAST